MSVIFERTYRAYVSEVDPDGHLSVRGLLHFLQDIALEHADRRGVAIRHLRPRGLTWVMTRYRLRVEARPPLFSDVLARTWPATLRGRTSCRAFLILDGQGSVVARAVAEFAVVRLATGRTVDIREALGEWPIHPEQVIEVPFSPIPEVGDSALERRFRARYSDVDINQHVNNAVYVGQGDRMISPG